MTELRVPVLYCDMDGTVRHGFDELGRFVNGPGDVVVFDGVPELLARYKAAGWRIVAISNQGGIAAGHVNERDVRAGMLETQRQAGGAFDKILYCKHFPAADDPEMAVCWCRKPKAGLVIEGALALAEDTAKRGAPEIYPPHLALFVGDRPEDEGCAEAAGIRFMPAAEWRTGKHADAL
jgi:D-glycero-D-manno-heptose 1,7-bisphosphate phosphatase